MSDDRARRRRPRRPLQQGEQQPARRAGASASATTAPFCPGPVHYVARLVMVALRGCTWMVARRTLLAGVPATATGGDHHGYLIGKTVVNRRPLSNQNRAFPQKPTSG